MSDPKKGEIVIDMATNTLPAGNYTYSTEVDRAMFTGQCAVLEMTPRLRWVSRMKPSNDGSFYQNVSVLQQAFVNVATGDITWNDVPFEEAV